MSEKTLEELQTENDALRDKNRELLDELKKAKAKNSDATEGTEALQQQVEELKAELHKHTHEGPVDEIFRETSGFGSIFRKAFEEHFQIQQGEDGKFYIHEKDGTPITKKGKERREVDGYTTDEYPLELDRYSLRSLIDERAVSDPALNDLSAFLPRPTGGGSMGSRVTSVTTSPGQRQEDRPTQKTEKPFGLR